MHKLDTHSMNADCSSIYFRVEFLILGKDTQSSRCNCYRQEQNIFCGYVSPSFVCMLRQRIHCVNFTHKMRNLVVRMLDRRNALISTVYSEMLSSMESSLTTIEVHKK